MVFALWHFEASRGKKLNCLTQQNDEVIGSRRQVMVRCQQKY